MRRQAGPIGMLGRALFGVALAALGSLPPAASGQTCALPASPAFAGHTLPLDSDPVPQSMRFDVAFPGLSFGAVTGIYAPPDGTNRLFVLEQVGRILAFENRNDVTSAATFLDIRSSVFSFGYEEGLLGLAFDPAYATNRRFYVNYTTSSGCVPNTTPTCTKIVRFEADPADPNRALPGSATVLLQYNQPFENHNGGAIAFGPDGLLYVASGDGGAGGDPFRNAQNRNSRLGKILRLDVRAGAPSLVPANNPYVGQPNADPFVLHSGLRNPWRITFDRLNGDLLIADVGEGTREEVNRVRAGSPGGLDFGWDYCEGTLDYRADANCSDIQSVPPSLEYDHFSGNGGSVIIGGYVYRGDLYPELYGSYLYADGASGNFWAWDGQDAANPSNPGNLGTLIGTAPSAISTFGEDQNGEIFAGSTLPNRIYRLVRNGTGGSGPAFPALLSATGLFANVATLMPASGLIEYDVTTPLWSDGATKRRWLALPLEGRIAFHARDAWDFPIGTVFVKHFELPRPAGGTRRVETRIFLRQVERWIGVTYRWNTAGTDATLLTSGLDESIDLGSGSFQDWHYPSTAECSTCHTAAAGRVLGARTRQLSGARTYAAGTQSQLDAWNCAKLFDFDIRDKNRFELGRAVGDTSASRTLRARSYMGANCEMCHQPGGPAPGGLDLRFTRAVGQWNVINVSPTEGNLGFPNAKRILPGNRFSSILWMRQAVTDPILRMAKGTRAIDSAATGLIGDWIQSDVANVDSDGDGVVDAIDLCPSIPDPLQQNGDGDLLGDRCDPDAQPDLVVLSQTTPSGSVLPGQPLALSALIRNDGSGAAASFPVTFALSTNSTYEPGIDVPVGHCWVESLSGGSTASCATSGARLPASFGIGQPSSTPYFFIACANRAEVEHEKSSTNDCTVAPQSVTVPEPSAALPIGWLGLVLLARRATGRAASRRLSGR